MIRYNGYLRYENSKTLFPNSLFNTHALKYVCVGCGKYARLALIIDARLRREWWKYVLNGRWLGFQLLGHRAACIADHLRRSLPH